LACGYGRGNPYRRREIDVPNTTVASFDLSIDGLTHQEAGRVAAAAVRRREHTTATLMRSGFARDAYQVNIHFAGGTGAATLLDAMRLIAEDVHEERLDDVLKNPGGY
jgi:hypothetical protein